MPSANYAIDRGTQAVDEHVSLARTDSTHTAISCECMCAWGGEVRIHIAVSVHSSIH